MRMRAKRVMMMAEGDFAAFQVSNSLPSAPPTSSHLLLLLLLLFDDYRQAGRRFLVNKFITMLQFMPDIVSSTLCDMSYSPPICTDMIGGEFRSCRSIPGWEARETDGRTYVSYVFLLLITTFFFVSYNVMYSIL